MGAGFAELGRRWKSLPQKTGSPDSTGSSGVDGGIAISAKQTERHTVLPSNSASFFAQRFGQAFPGVRTIQWYEGKEAIKRLAVLLQEPLVFNYKDGQTTPIWWWRYGNFQIQSFKTLSRDVVLLDTKELRVKRIAAVPSTSYCRSFVYLEASPMKPCGAYEWDEEKRERFVHDHGYAQEEYGLYQEKHVVNRAKYDDNAAVIKGKLVELGSGVELRERYITPYNLIIAPHLSPINNPDFDAALRSFMDRMLQGQADVKELENQVEHLPKPRAWGQYK